MNRLMILSSLLLAGCATSMTTGVLKLGPDTYKISSRHAPISGGENAAQADVFNTSNAYCEDKGKEVLVKNQTRLYNSQGVATGYEIIFQCLDHGDRHLVRPNYEQAPNVVIKTEGSER